MPDNDRSTMDLLRSSRITAYSIGLICLVAGLVLLFWPDRTWTVIARVIGVLFVIIGFGQSVEAITTHRQGSYWGMLLLRGLINLVVGLVLIFWPSATVTVVVWLVGLDLVITGVLALIVSFQVPKEMGRSSLLVQSVITVVLGVLIMAWPDATLTVIGVLLAALLILFGLMLLISGYQLSKAKVEIRGT
jgi:uncharacterized membrane protein HdeD (DUF308 family)